MKTKRLIWLLGLALVAALFISGTAFAEGEEISDPPPAGTSQSPPPEEQPAADSPLEEPSAEEPVVEDPAAEQEAAVPEDTQSGEGEPAEDPAVPEPAAEGPQAAEEPAAGGEPGDPGAADADEGTADPATAETTGETLESAPQEGTEPEADSADPDALADPYYYVGGVKQEFFGITGIQDAIDNIWGTGVLPDDGLIYVEALNAYNGFTIDAGTHSILATLLGVVSVSDNGSADTIISGNIWVEDLTSGFTLSGFTVNGGVTFKDNSGDLDLSDLVVKNTAGDGIFVANHVGDINLTDVKANGSSGANVTNGAALDNPGGGNVTITNSAFDHNSGTNTGRGLYISTGGIVTINGLSASGNSHSGLNISGFSRLSISNAAVKYNGENGIFISTSQAANVTLQNIYVMGNSGYFGMELITPGSVTASNIYACDNTGTNTNGARINVTGGSGTVRLTNGFFHGNSQYGLQILANGAITLNSVQATGNGNTGVYLENSGGSGSVLVTSPKSAGAAGVNIFSDNGNYGLQVYASGAVTLTNLLACGNTAEGLILNNTWAKGNVTINKNLAGWTNRFDGNSSGMYIQTLSNILISDTSASGNLTGEGLNTTSGALNVTITRASFDQNKTEGAYIQASGIVRLTDVSASHNGVGGTYSGLRVDNTWGTGAVILSASGKNVYRDFNGNTNYGVFIRSQGSVSVSGVRVQGNLPQSGLYVDNRPGFGPDVSLSGVIAHLNGDNGLQVFSRGSIYARDLDVYKNGGRGADFDTSGGTGSVVISSSSKTRRNRFEENTGIGMNIYSWGSVTISSVQSEGNGYHNLYIDTSSGSTTVAVSVASGLFSGSLSGDGLRIITNGAVTLTDVMADGNTGYGAFINASPGTTAASVSVRGKLAGVSFSGNGSSGLHITTQGAVSLQNVAADENSDYGIYIYNRFSGSAAPARITAGKAFWNSASDTKGTNYALTIYSYGAVSIARLNCERNQYSGAYILNTRESSSLPVRAVSIASSTFSESVAYDGLSIVSEGPVTIRDSHVDDNQRSGMWIITQGTVTLSGITANGNQGATSEYYSGVAIDNSSGAGDVIITSTKAVPTEFSRNKYHGLYIYTDGFVSIANACAEHNTVYGIYVSQSASVSVTNTSRTAAIRFSDNLSRGLTLISSGPVTLSGNILVENNGGYGVYIDNLSPFAPLPVTISGLTASGNARNGIYVVTYGDVTASDLIIERNGFGATGNDRSGMFINNYQSGNGSGSVTLSGRSTFSHNNFDGLYLASNGVINISGVTAYGNGNDGLRVSGNGTGKSVTLRDIATINNADNGLYLEAMGDQSLRGITSLMNGGNGIETWLQGYYALLQSCMVMSNDGHGISIYTWTGGTYDLLNTVTIGNNADNIGAEKDLNITT